jgi:hypothetical protein
MKLIVSVIALAGLSIGSVACKTSKSATTSTSGAPTTTVAPQAAADNAKPAAAAAAAPAFVQKGVKPGKIVVGYMQDLSDPNVCAAVTDAPEKKQKFLESADQLAKIMKGKIVSACPTTDVVGTCNVGLGMLANYSGPKWTAETARKDCAKQRGTWVD